jgi:hypothetical protein
LTHPTEQHAHQAARERVEGKSARRRLIERATVMGLLFSVAVHLVIMLIAALVTVDFGFADAGGNRGDEVDFAVLTSAELAQMQSPKVTQESFEVAAIPTDALRIDLLSDNSTEDSVNELADSIAPSLNPGGGALTSIDSSTGSAGAGTGDGASFFGLEAQGRRFAYIVDISGSMNTLTEQGAFTRWELTRGELIRSIDALDEHAEFAIVLYSSNAVAVFGQGIWTTANRNSKAHAARTLMGFDPGGGTRPLGGFQTIFKLDPEADAIYFMTDGLFDSEIPLQIRQLNRRELTPIHTILFGELADTQDAITAQNMMRNIARNSGGKFTHIKDGRP